MKDHFYYLKLRTALKDFGISDTGIEEIMNNQILTTESDRRAVYKVIRKLVSLEQSGLRIVDSTPQYVSARLAKDGFSLIARRQLENGEVVNDPAQREKLKAFLRGGLVMNERRVPRGLPGHMKQIWKNKQIQKNEER